VARQMDAECSSTQARCISIILQRSDLQYKLVVRL
jgi:hypothetical protein